MFIFAILLLESFCLFLREFLIMDLGNLFDRLDQIDGIGEVEAPHRSKLSRERPDHMELVLVTLYDRQKSTTDQNASGKIFALYSSGKQNGGNMFGRGSSFFV